MGLDDSEREPDVERRAACALLTAHVVRNGARGEVRRVATNKPHQLALFPARRLRALAVGGRGMGYWVKG